MTLRGGGGGGPALSVTMTLIFPKIVWTCPLCTVNKRSYLIANAHAYTRMRIRNVRTYGHHRLIKEKSKDKKHHKN